MSNIYKIETFCESYVSRIADCITKAGGHCVIRGWAVLTDHVFDAQQTQKLFPMVSRTTDDLTDDDMYVWMNSDRAAA
ncbi:hypothetical protein CSW98_11770 [Vibrio sp. HA2012]|uniref:hypothetical protein n=1 Tax=Vibrio sp. HA2012 TaxID=1971595 RepID=UPI000C2B6F0E|nr:hypothetical protein [Vibrio sp. HA2012]PJC86237.1 hypothetical protein CSW98_11770 [Vibrio sp. HA2012]